MIRIQQLLSEFVQLYRVIHPNKKLAVSINELNNGLCYFVAGSVGRVLVKEGIPVSFCHHAHHAWLKVAGVDYDTLFPEGYTQPVAKAWLLDVMGLNDRESSSAMTPSDDETGGYTPNHPSFIFIYKAWALHHGLPIPTKWNKLKCPKGISPRYFRRLEARYKKALALTYLEEPLPANQVLPFTHFTLDSIEEDLTRPLVPYPFMRSVKTYKILFKDFREKGTPIQMM